MINIAVFANGKRKPASLPVKFNALYDVDLSW